MKKTGLLLASLCFALAGLTACGGSAAPAGASSAPSAAPAETVQAEEPAAEAAPQPETQENQYYEAASEIVLADTGLYTVTLDARPGWKWNIPENTDVTAWLVDAQGSPAFTADSGIAAAQLVYGPAEGEAEEVPVSLILTIDAARIPGFAHNGCFDLYVQPTGKDTLWVTGENHGQYQDSAVRIGTVALPAVTVDGILAGSANGTLELTQGSVPLTLTLDGLDDSRIDSSNVTIELLDGDGYDKNQYLFTPGELGSWADGTAEYYFGDMTGVFSPQGGDGNGHYRFRIGISGLRYNGLPLAQAIVWTDLYSYGRTFSVDGGSLILNTEPVWSSADAVPVLCDAYPDEFSVLWPVGYDASALEAGDLSVQLQSEYGETLALEPGTDFTVEATATGTRITLQYIYWAYAPVYTRLEVSIATDHVTADAQMYAKPAAFSHTYDIASVYVYSVMSGGPTGTQSWTYFGFENLTDPAQVFAPATYTLVWTDSAGDTFYYAEDAQGRGLLTGSAEEALAFNCDAECNVRLEGQTVSYDRLYDQTEEKTVDGQTLVFAKSYRTAETLPKAIADLEGLETAPGYTLGASWEDHLKWPWQSFIGTGFQGGSK